MTEVGRLKYGVLHDKPLTQDFPEIIAGITKVTAICERHPRTGKFDVVVKAYPSEGKTLKPSDPTAKGYAWPTRYLHCANCGRRYFLMSNRHWESDRDLTIIDERR